MKTDERILPSSGNVFADLALPDAEDELIKARIVAILQSVIETRELTQTAAAEIIGLAQPDLSRLLRGRVSGFSLERLLGFLRALGSDVEIKVTKAGLDRHGHMRLMVA